jgi:hypothetical protein
MKLTGTWKTRQQPEISDFGANSMPVRRIIVKAGMI